MTSFTRCLGISLTLLRSLTMLDRLGEVEAGAAVLKAIESTLVDKSLCTRDVGGTANTAAGHAIGAALA